MEKSIKNTLYKIGALRGMIAACLGACTFLVTEIFGLVIVNGPIQVDSFLILGLFFLLFGAFFLSITPSVIGSMWLALRIFELMKNEQAQNRRIFILGGKVGFIIGLGICALVIVMYFYRADIWITIIQTIIVTLISTLFAGIFSLIIKRDILKSKLVAFYSASTE